MKKEAIAHGVLEDLANRNDNWDKLDGVPEKVDLLIESKADKTYVDTKLSEKANKQQEAWITPTLLNGWTEFSGCTVRYMKDEFGFVHVKGAITGFTGTLPSLALTFPVGYRPNQMIGFSTQANNSVVIPIYITNLGNIVIAGATKTAIFLDTISFRAEA